MKIKELLGVTKDGQSVYFTDKSSHATTHFADHPHLKELVQTYLPTIDTTTHNLRYEIDTQTVAGHCDLVTTDDTDEIVYAKRPHRSTYSRFVKNKHREPTSWIVIALQQDTDATYYLYTAFIGRLTPSFPGGNYKPEESKRFWQTHALCWGSQTIVPGTETNICPW